MGLRPKHRKLSALLLLCAAAAAGASPLPEPLTLADSLASAVNAEHPELLELRHRLQAIDAELGITRGDYGFSLDLQARIREIGPSDVAESEDPIDDNAASLILSRPLYDFGGQDSRERVLELRKLALETELQLRIELRRIEIMQRYFDVLDADNLFLAENEALAIAFNRYERAQENFELGLAAEIDVLRLQSEFERVRRVRFRAQQQQRLTRARLAVTLGYPESLPATLIAPEIGSLRELPQNVEALVERALAHSLEARASDIRTRAAQATIGIAEAEDNGSIGLEFEISRYSRETSTRDDWRAGIYFDIPLYSASSDARVDRATAGYREALARQTAARRSLRLEVLELWQELNQLRIGIEGLEVAREYRDRYLDRSRAEYLLEFRTDLGDSQIEYARTNAERLRTIYAFEVAWRRLALLVGEDFLKPQTQ